LCASSPGIFLETPELAVDGSGAAASDGIACNSPGSFDLGVRCERTTGEVLPLTPLNLVFARPPLPADGPLVKMAFQRLDQGEDYLRRRPVVGS